MDKKRETELQKQILSSIHRMKCIRMDDLMNGVSQQEFFLLQLIASHEDDKQQGICVSDLAQQMKVSAPAISRRLGTLEEKGLIERRSNHEDRRNTYVKLTSDGSKIREETCKKMDALICRVIEEVGEKDVTEMIRLWNRFADQMVFEADKIRKKHEKTEEMRKEI